MKTFSFVCNEALTLTSLLKHIKMDEQWIRTFGSASALTRSYQRWHKQIRTNPPHYWSVISLIKSRVTPQDKPWPATKAGLRIGWTLLLFDKWRTHSQSHWALHNNNTAWLFAVLILIQTKWSGGEGGRHMKLLVSSRRKRCLRHWFTLGSDPQCLIIAMGI